MKEIALVGNPNSGKTSLFNALTGLRFTTANYPGVTVEKRTGKMETSSGEILDILDLPGTYSLIPRSLDEQIVHDVLLGVQVGTPQPSLLVVVVDSNSLERNLYFATQVIDLGLPTIFALNMWDLAESNGISIDLKKLESLLGVPCVKTVAVKKDGTKELKAKIQEIMLSGLPSNESKRFQLYLPQAVSDELKVIETLIHQEAANIRTPVRMEALRLLTDESEDKKVAEKGDFNIRFQIEKIRKQLESVGVDWRSVESECRYSQINAICDQVVSRRLQLDATLSERIDRVLTHQIYGPIFFMAFMGVLFQSIFTWARIPMDMIAALIERLGQLAGGLLPEGKLQSLVVDGMIAGVGNVIVFLPQIFLLFFFIAVAEDFGYMARAAFVLDRVMRKVGLSGKAFLPLLSSFACAIPGVMATRTIGDRNERFTTILVAPLMSCSARLPVYTLMIGAFIPSVPIFGGFDLKGLTLFSMYFLSILGGLTMATVFRKTLLKGSKTPFVFELPPYRFPNFKTVLLTMWDRGKEFLNRAGTIIFAISIILWFLSSYPNNPASSETIRAEKIKLEQTLTGASLDQALMDLHKQEVGQKMRDSYAGRLGKFIEPVIHPLGFDWKIGVGLVASFAAREVLVSSLAIVYNVGENAGASSTDLIQVLRNEISPETGKALYSPLTAVSLMVFFVFACQCMSTLAIVKRETNSWRWPIFMFIYMSILAYAASFLVYQGGRLLGFA